MADERTQRRIAAILAADVVGYSRLMELDESGTLALLKTRRKEVLEPAVARHKGRIFKFTGDGVMVEFASAVDAVECAVDLQRAMEAANAGQPEERRIVLRIGINLGDVIAEGGDLYGDGVNIAARLEAMAEPGGVLVSGPLHDFVRNKIKAGFEDLGPRGLKNIAEPVRIYRVASGAPAAGKKAGPVPDKPLIAVLPFDNLSANPEEQYFSDGITEDITTELARFHGLSVLSRHASFQFQGKGGDIKRIREETGATYVLEGSVRRLGDRIRIAAQLIDAVTGSHVWAERFDSEQREIFAVQDKVVRTIVATVVGRVEASGTAYARRKPPASLMAYDYVLRGKALPVGDPAAEAEARQMYEKVIELDPTYGFAYSLLAYILTLEAFRETAVSSGTRDRALEMAKKAIQYDDTNSDCHSVLGWVYLDRKAFELSEQSYRHAIALNPNNPLCITGMAEWFCYAGRPLEGLELFEQAKQIDPHFNPGWWWRTMGIAYFTARQYDVSIASFNRAPIHQTWVKCYLAACHAYMGRSDSAAAITAEVLRLDPDFSSRRLVDKEPFMLASDQDHLFDGMRKAGLPK